MAKVGTGATRWVKYGIAKDLYGTDSDTRTHYALRTDGKVVKKSSMRMADGKWHDWGWKRVTLRGAPVGVAAVDALLTAAGYTRD